MAITKSSEPETCYPKNRKQWRTWLGKYHEKKTSVWVIMYKKKADKPSINWDTAVDEALCYGWIDSKARPIDDEKYMQFFSKRKPTSAWSKINKEKIRNLIADGLMQPAGLASIERAKQNGSWSALDEVEELVIPKDLEKEFKKHKGSKAFFLSLSKSVRKMMLAWISFAKRPETRQKRISEIAEHAGRKVKPKQF